MEAKKNLDILLFEIKNKAFFYFYDILNCDPVGKQRTKEVGWTNDFFQVDVIHYVGALLCTFKNVLYSPVFKERWVFFLPSLQEL